MRWALEYGLDYGENVKRIRAVGGGSMGSVWTQIIADVLERPLETIAAPQDAGAIGAAACALVGSGAKPNYSFLADRVAVTHIYLPDAGRCARILRPVCPVQKALRRPLPDLSPHAR